jgi:hypothetical protein
MHFNCHYEQKAGQINNERAFASKKIGAIVLNHPDGDRPWHQSPMSEVKLITDFNIYFSAIIKSCV